MARTRRERVHADNFDFTVANPDDNFVTITFSLSGCMMTVEMSAEEFKRVLKAMLKFDERLSNG